MSKRILKIKTIPNSVHNNSQFNPWSIEKRTNGKHQSLHSLKSSLLIRKINKIAKTASKKVQFGKKFNRSSHNSSFHNKQNEKEKSILQIGNRSKNVTNLKEYFKHPQDRIQKLQKQKLHYFFKSNKNGGFRFDRKISMKYYNQQVITSEKRQNSIQVLGNSVSLTPSIKEDNKKSSDKKVTNKSSDLIKQRLTPQKQKYRKQEFLQFQKFDLQIKSVYIQYPSKKKYGQQHYIQNIKAKSQFQAGNWHINSKERKIRLLTQIRRLKPYHSQVSLHMPSSFFITNSGAFNK